MERMIEEELLDRKTEAKYHRVICDLRGEPGNTVFIVAGQHGNEHSGVIAAQAVARKIEEHNLDIKGRFITLAGNLKALTQNERFIDVDLNRIWHFDENGLTGEKVAGTAEWEEFQSIRDHIEEAERNVNGEIYFIDLHTTSAPSVPFIMIGDTFKNRLFLRDVLIPTVIGVEETLNGTLMSYFSSRGHRTMGFEAGQHDDQVSIMYQEEMIWTLLIKADCIDKEHVEEIANISDFGTKSWPWERSIYEVVHREKLIEGDDVKVKDGYVNFQPIHPEEEIGVLNGRKLKCHSGGHIFMPLYQEKGDEAYFILKKISFIREVFSGISRFLGLYWLLLLLGGVSRDGHIRRLNVTQKARRQYGMALFRFFGYREVRRSGDHFVVIKKLNDF